MVVADHRTWLLILLPNTYTQSYHAHSGLFLDIKLSVCRNPTVTPSPLFHIEPYAKMAYGTVTDMLGAKQHLPLLCL